MKLANCGYFTTVLHFDGPAGAGSIEAACGERAAMTASLQSQIEQLTSRMLRKKLFVVTLKAKTTPDKMAPYLAQHLEYMTELSRQSVLFASGPFVGANGAPTGDGVSIFNTATADEARQFAERDPFYVHGLREIEVREWVLMEGSMSINLDFAQCRVSIT